MILGASSPLKVGCTYFMIITDNNMKLMPEQPMFIKRQATYEEYAAWCIQTECIPKSEILTAYKYFYEVSTD